MKYIGREGVENFTVLNVLVEKRKRERKKSVK